MSESNIYSDIRKYIADKIARNETIEVPWLAQEILASKSDIEGDDAEFYRDCTLLQLREMVKRCVGKYEAKVRTDEQLVLKGFEHLQIAYPVERGGKNQLVPVEQLSDRELELRAQEYDRMALGCRAHAKEIRDYIAARAGEATA